MTQLIHNLKQIGFGLNSLVNPYLTVNLWFSWTISYDMMCFVVSWYHGSIGRIEAEELLRPEKGGSFLVRISESSKLDYSLSLK